MGGKGEMNQKEKIACVLGGIYVIIMLYVLYRVLSIPPNPNAIRPSWMMIIGSLFKEDSD